MARHPHDQTLQCHRRKGETLFGADGSPSDFTGQPCRCRLWMNVMSMGDSTTNTPPRQVQGCFFELFPWMLSGAIVKANLAAAEAAAARKEMQGITGGLRALALLTIDEARGALPAAQDRPQLGE